MNKIKIANKRINKKIVMVKKLLNDKKYIKHYIFLSGVKAGLQTAKTLLPLKEEL